MTNGDETREAAGGNGQAAQPHVSILTQYIKDFSFENPNAPRSLGQQQTQPRIDIEVNVTAAAMGGDVYEVSLHLTARAQAGEVSAFLAELVYAGLFRLQNVPEQSLQPVCMIECPRILFPFARRVVADVTRDGGYPPLLIDPIDFSRLYLRQQQSQTASAGQQTDTTAAAPQNEGASDEDEPPRD